MPIQLITIGTNGACVTGVLGTELVCVSTTKKMDCLFGLLQTETCICTCSVDDEVLNRPVFKKNVALENEK